MTTLAKVNAAFESEAARMGIPGDKVWKLYGEVYEYLPKSTTLLDVLFHMRDIWRDREMTIDEGVGWT